MSNHPLPSGLSLEPQWSVVCDSLEPKYISASDRRKLPFGRVGDGYTNDLEWAELGSA